MTHILSLLQFTAISNTIASKTNLKTLTASDIIFYNIARGKHSTCGFTPISNSTKLAAGTDKWSGYIFAKDYLTRNMSRYPARLNVLLGEHPMTVDQLELVNSMISMP